MTDKIQWHPAFFAAMKLEKNENKRHLDCYDEYNLNHKPLQIDKNDKRRINRCAHYYYYPTATPSISGSPYQDQPFLSWLSLSVQPGNR